MSDEPYIKFDEEVKPFIRFGAFSGIISASQPCCSDEENKIRNENLYKDLKQATLPGGVPLEVVPLGSYYHDLKHVDWDARYQPPGIRWEVPWANPRDLDVRKPDLFDAAFFVRPSELGRKKRLLKHSPYRQRLVSFWEELRDLGLNKYNQNCVMFFRGSQAFFIEEEQPSLRKKLRIWNIDYHLYFRSWREFFVSEEPVSISDKFRVGDTSMKWSNKRVKSKWGIYVGWCSDIKDLFRMLRKLRANNAFDHIRQGEWVTKVGGGPEEIWPDAS